MAALVVMIINKDESAVVSSHTPSIVNQAAKLPVIRNTPSEFHAITELGYQSCETNQVTVCNTKGTNEICYQYRNIRRL